MKTWSFVAGAPVRVMLVRVTLVRVMPVLVVAALAGVSAGCKKEAGRSDGGFPRALQRMNAAASPAEMEWPLAQLRKLADGDGDRDTKLAARFELARGWLRTSVLTFMPRDAPEANRVLAATGCKDPGAIIAAFDEVVAAGEVKGTDIVGWAREGAKLVRSVGSGEGTAEQRLGTVTELAFGGGAFGPEAIAFVLADLAAVPRRQIPEDVRERVQPVPAPEVERRLRSVLRYVCPGSVGALKGAGERAERVAAFAAGCKGAPWLQGTSASELAAAGPCKDLPLAGPSAEARALVGAYFNRLAAAFEKGGGGQKPPLLYLRFPADQICPAAGNLVEWLADGPVEAAAGPAAAAPAAEPAAPVPAADPPAPEPPADPAPAPAAAEPAPAPPPP